MELVDDTPLDWSFKFSSHQFKNPSDQLSHATGVIYLQPAKDADWKTDFVRHETTIAGRHLQLLAQDCADTSIEGSFIYETLPLLSTTLSVLGD